MELESVEKVLANKSVQKQIYKLASKTKYFFMERGITQDVIARCFGVSRVVINRWLNGDTIPYARGCQFEDLMSLIIDREEMGEPINIEKEKIVILNPKDYAD